MATLDASSIDKFTFDFEELARLPDDVVEAMLEAEGEVIKAGQAETAKSMLPSDLIETLPYILKERGNKACGEGDLPP